MYRIIQEETLTGIADAIRYKREMESLIKPEEMAEEILNIKSGGLAIFIDAETEEY